MWVESLPVRNPFLLQVGGERQERHCDLIAKLNLPVLKKYKQTSHKKQNNGTALLSYAIEECISEKV